MDLLDHVLDHIGVCRTSAVLHDLDKQVRPLATLADSFQVVVDAFVDFVEQFYVVFLANISPAGTN